MEIPSAIEMAMLQDAQVMADISQEAVDLFTRHRVDQVTLSYKAPRYVAETIAKIWIEKGYEVTVFDNSILIKISQEIRDAVQAAVTGE